MFIAKAEGELTQVDFWTNYRDLFTPFTQQNLLVASELIKNVSTVFPNAQAMVIPAAADGSHPQKFVIKGIARRKIEIEAVRFKCQWDGSNCTTDAFAGPEDLLAHVNMHLEALESGSEFACSWATCQHSASSLPKLKPHVWTHFALKRLKTDATSELPQVTFLATSGVHPRETPTQRPPPPPPSTTVSFTVPAREPPSGALTALLIIRTLFRAAFASYDAAPRADADHFGFPGVLEETEELDRDGELAAAEAEAEGERRARRAFVGVRTMMESVKIREPVLMGWIEEMIEAGITGTH